jgi:hypothetical protein
MFTPKCGEENLQDDRERISRSIPKIMSRGRQGSATPHTNCFYIFHSIHPSPEYESLRSQGTTSKVLHCQTWTSTPAINKKHVGKRAVAAPSTEKKKRVSKLQYFGVNESGAEFGNTAIPGELGKDYTWSVT